MKSFKIIGLLGMLIASSGLMAQEVLTVSKAIEVAIESNYDVRIARNETEISDIETGLLNSGYLPSVSASGNVNYSDEYQNVVFSDGSNTEIDNAITESYGVSLLAEYIIFDGLERKFNIQKNIENLSYAKLEERQSIENTVISIYETYYNVAYQAQVVDNLLLTIENSNDRLERAKRKLKYGQGTKLDQLNAQVDLNNDSISYASALKDYKNARRDLNLLLGRDVTTNFEIDTTVVVSTTLNQEDILQSSSENNINSLLNKQNILLSELDIKINKVKFLPKINGSASYDWNESKNPVTSFALENQVSGINLGFGMSWNLFDGGRNKTNVKTSKITKANREIELYRAKEELRTQVYNGYEDYENKKFTFKAENNNVLTNKLNFNRTQKQASLGQVSAVDFRQAQINLFNALNNLAKAKYDLKIAEINLLQLAGRLID